MREIKAVVFDMDGVLLETEKEYVSRFEKVFQNKGIAYTNKDLEKLIGCSGEKLRSLLSQLGSNKYTFEEVWHFFEQTFVEEPVDYKAITTKGVKDLLTYLKKEGYRIGISSSTAYAEIVEKLKEAELYDYFDAISSGYDCVCGKPDPEVYHKTMNALGVLPEECLVIEDSVYGLQAGRNAGAYVLGRKIEMVSVDQSAAHELFVDMDEVRMWLERRKCK